MHNFETARGPRVNTEKPIKEAADHHIHFHITIRVYWIKRTTLRIVVLSETLPGVLVLDQLVLLGVA